MKPILSILIILLCGANSYAQTNPYNQPWLDTNTVIIIDAYGPNAIDWDNMKQDKRVAGIIHKATDGSKTDTLYNERKTKALEQGYLFGSYHLGRSGDPVQQADHYLATTGNYENELLALDLESLESQFMSLENAILFINRIYEKTGRYPYLYCNHTVLTQINDTYDRTSVFYQCKLWYARFRKDIPGFNQTIWPGYTLWQFSSEINCKKTGECLYNVPGTQYDMDINVYNGNLDSLKNVWAK